MGAWMPEFSPSFGRGVGSGGSEQGAGQDYRCVLPPFSTLPTWFFDGPGSQPPAFLRSPPPQ